MHTELETTRLIHGLPFDVSCRGSICQAGVVRSVYRPTTGVVRSASVLSPHPVDVPAGTSQTPAASSEPALVSSPGISVESSVPAGTSFPQLVLGCRVGQLDRVGGQPPDRLAAAHPDRALTGAKPPSGPIAADPVAVDAFQQFGIGIADQAQRAPCLKHLPQFRINRRD